MNTNLECKWIFNNNLQNCLPEENLQAENLAKELNISPILSKILINRNIDTYQKAREFFKPTIDDLHDPFLMDTMDLAVERINTAILKNEKIAIYGDYDVDGTNSTAMLYNFFKKLNTNICYFIPDRIKDGYGVTDEGIKKISELSCTLLITVDCGITAIKQVEYAQSICIDVIICDHHEPTNIIPNAVAVLDPIKISCKYPYKYLCGCGVAYKLIQALTTLDVVQNKIGDQIQKILLDYLQFVTLATTADIVPLTGENRIMVKLGLELINSIPLNGIRALIETAGGTIGKISTGQIVFMLAPRINAVGRIGDANRAVEMLTSDSYNTSIEIAKVMEGENLQRRKIDEETFNQAKEIVEKEINLSDKTAIILHKDDWHAGVVGIVASRLVEKYYRPSIMMTTVDGFAKGSARSISGFNIHDALKKCEDYLIQFGGHKYAAGLSLEINKVAEFRTAFNKIASEILTDEMLIPKIYIDAEINLFDINQKFLRILNLFAPFGPENMRPIFCIKNVDIYGHPRIVGKNHIKFKIKRNSVILDAIGFNLGHLIDNLQNGKKVDIAFSLDEGEYAGETVPQLKIKDIKML